MTPEAQRIAIAEACGWGKLTISIRGSAPDYLNDLNAMHEAEKVLGDKSFEFDKILKDVVFSGTRVCSFDSYAGDFIWHATAAQRAEAFLRAIGRWV